MKNDLKFWILLLLAFWLILSCSPERNTIVEDGCEYIETTSFTGQGAVVSLAHKGNCKNPIHKIVIDTCKTKILN